MSTELLFNAIKENDIDTVKLIIASRKNDIETLDQHGCVALHYASWNGRVDICELLITEGVNVNVIDQYNQTPLHYASEIGRVDICELLIKAGVKVNIISQFGQSALHLASSRERVDICELLIKAGANIHVMDSGGNTLLDYANHSIRNTMIQIYSDVNDLKLVFDRQLFDNFFYMPISSLLTRCTVYKKIYPKLPSIRNVKIFLDQAIGMESQYIKDYAQSFGFPYALILNEVTFLYKSSYNIFVCMALDEIQENNIEDALQEWKKHSSVFQNKDLLTLIFSYLEECDIKFKQLPILSIKDDIIDNTQEDALITGDIMVLLNDH